MLAWLRSLWPTAPQKEPPSVQPTDDGPLSARRWDAAQTDRLNAAHWQGAHGQPINVDLLSDLPTLRARCGYEATNNPMVEGVIETHTLDVIGPRGPQLKVISDSQAYNDALQDIWEEWFADPDISGTMSGVEMLGLMNHSLWTKGPILALITDDRSATTSATMRVQNLDAERLQTPMQFSGDNAVTLGIRRTKEGRPLQYYIAEPSQWGQWEWYSGKFSTYAADDVIHEYRKIEAAQATGYPLLASCLQEIADLRDFDIQTLDAARAAADWAVYFANTQPEFVSRGVDADVPDGSRKVERRTEKYLPPGWIPSSMSPNHPSPEYKPFRHEKLRSLGRAVHMPLLLVLLSAEQANFSQSRLDVNVFYERGLDALRCKLYENRILNRLVKLVEREARLARRNGRWMLPARPDRVRFEWGWEPIPQADPLKDAQSIALELREGLISYDEALARLGRSMSRVIAQRAEANRMLAAAGLPPIPGPDGTSEQSEETEESKENATV